MAEPADGGVPLVQEGEDVADVVAAPVRVERPSQTGEPGPPVPHIGKDYSYVRAEVMRILAVAGFLLLSLVVTAILRH